ncbi:MAG: ATP-binding cassette domain-containing protein [Phycisphaerales bacterium]|nr:ATP-binding cassette domain-containing protein [Phycisphaerales bacterium]
MRYVWPHRKFLYPAVICIFLMVVTYSASIGSILPVLKVLVEDEGLHGSVNKYIAEDRFGCTFITYNSARDREVRDIEDRTAQIRRPKPDSPLYEASLRGGDFIVALNGTPLKALDLFKELASSEQESLEITYRSADGEWREPVQVQVPPLTQKTALARSVIGMIPGGQSKQERMRTLLVILGLLIVVVVVGNAARFMAEYLTVIINTLSILDMRRHMYTHVLRLPLDRFSDNTSDTMSRFVQDTNDIFRGLNNFFQIFVTEPFKAIGPITIAFLLDWQFTLFLLLGTPLAAILFRKIGKMVRRANRRMLVQFGQMLSRLESTLNGMRVVKAYMRENYERRRLFQVDRIILKQQARMGMLEALSSPVIETGAFLIGAAVIYFIANRMLDESGDTGVARFVTLLVCMGAIFDPVRKLSNVYPKLQRANAAAERIFELIDSESEYDQDAGKPDLPTICNSIEFDQVTFRYPKADRPAVSEVSLSVRKNEIIALVGPNGSGKTTLLSLLPRFYNPTAGRILIDGLDIRDISIRSLRKHFGLITQESVIFPDSVRANIAYGRPDASDEEIKAAARRAFAEEFILQLPDGYDTVLGEHGATLSGGQRQRLAIARAILRDAPILIFDEATSQVDPESEMKIQQALETILENRTAFIIAHRYATISGADRIVVMDEGKIVAVGAHKQLLESCPLYRRLYETQFRNEEG